MAENRLARSVETRDSSMRLESWRRPEALPEPDKQPGFSYRWIRVTYLNRADTKNISAKLREGWEPVRIEEQPKFKFFLDPDSRFKDNIEVAGLLLCKMPEEFVEQRSAFYAKHTKDNMMAVDNNFLKESDPRMPLFSEKQTKVRFGKGN
jgi:hypothetical protein